MKKKILSVVALVILTNTFASPLGITEEFCQQRAIDTHEYLLSRDVDHFISYTLSEYQYQNCMRNVN
jgi:hypothetical protein